jgi:hypothetical protein
MTRRARVAIVQLGRNERTADSVRRKIVGRAHAALQDRSRSAAYSIVAIARATLFFLPPLLRRHLRALY